MTKKEKAFIKGQMKKYETWAAEETAAAENAPDETYKAECYRQAELLNAKAIALEHLLMDLTI